MKTSIKLSLILSVVGIYSTTGQAAFKCSDLLSEMSSPSLIIKSKASTKSNQLEINLHQKNARDSWAQYNSKEALATEKPTLDGLQRLYQNKIVTHVISLQEATSILHDTDLPLYGKILSEVVQKLESAQGNTDQSFENALNEVLLSYHYTTDIINTRIQMLKSADKKNWHAILGDLSLQETQVLFYGGDVQHPTEGSLLGQYLKQTGAKTKMVGFAKKYREADLGPEKLVVAVSPQTFEKFKEIILSNHHFMTVVGHANVIHGGNFYNYNGQKSEIRALGQGTPFPLLILKTTESQRMTRYMDLTTDPRYSSWIGQNPLKKPWYLENYCAKGGYECCTHWLGNIPLGDQLVKEYSFPPSEYGQAPKGPQIKPLQDYITTEQNSVLKTVWKNPGHMQLSEMMGQKEANVTGEMASPGYVLHTMIGPTSAERIPLVFWMTNDHTTEIPIVPTLNYEQPR